jgi:hypothetical protein
VQHVVLAMTRVQLPTKPNPAASPRRAQLRLRVGGADADPTDTSSLLG